jgi:hypothetical protein
LWIARLLFPNPGSKEAPRLTVIPGSARVMPVHNSPTTSFSEVLIEKGRSAILVRIPVRKPRLS